MRQHAGEDAFAELGFGEFGAGGFSFFFVVIVVVVIYVISNRMHVR